MRFFSFLSVFSVCAAGLLHAVEPVTKKIDLLEVIKAGKVEYHVNPKADFHDAPKDIWKFAADGTFDISGRGYGYVATKDIFRDYHLVLEFKWGTKTWGKREHSAKDNGILLHAYGPHGAYADTWMASIEAQIIEGGVGDILVLSPKLADGTVLTTSISTEYTLDRDKEKIWKKGEPRQTLTNGRINWKHRDVDWADKRGFRGREDVESPSGEWNRLEVIAKGDTLQYFVNGALVNEAFDCKPSEGKILLQTEGAEMIVRRYELYPLGEFKEKWSAIQASGGSDVSVRDGQAKALSPEESMKRIQLDGDYEVQLVAAEPLVLDPVECTWDAQGHMYVADMRDYPLGPPNAGDPWLSRIQMLSDEDGDGRMDKAVTFADHMDNVQGLLPYNGGLIATTRSQILFLKDTDGDGKADEIKSLIKGFNPKHAQLQVSAPRWGLDGCVHFNNGLDAREIYPADKPKDIVNIPGSNFKWDPRTDTITVTGGKGQYGGGFDDWGHHFYCSNRNPLMFTVMPYAAMLHNPHAGITQNYEDIAPFGAETRVFPLQITHTTADAHAGTNTACSGLGVYRGPLMPELKNNVFVPDPTGQLVTRYKVAPNGASLKATRVGDRTEFFRSSDEWCRPVNFTTGPDGAIYICDIYRRWIDHARFFPEEFVKTHDMRQGENEGRIWRVVPKGKKAPKVEAAPQNIEKIVAWLGNENAWQRETAQRLLAGHSLSDFGGITQKFMEKHGFLKEPLFTMHWSNLMADLAARHGIGKVAMNFQHLNPWFYSFRDGNIDENNWRIWRLGNGGRGFGNISGHLFSGDPRIRFLEICERQNVNLDVLVSLASASNKLKGSSTVYEIDDPWVQRALLSRAADMSGELLSRVLKGPAFTGWTAQRQDFILHSTSSCIANAQSKDVHTLLELLKSEPGQLLWWKPGLLQGLADGLPKSGGKLGVKSLAQFITNPPQGFEEAAKEIATLQSEIDAIIADPKAPLDQRLAVMPLLATRKWDAVQPVVKTLLTTNQPPELVTAALALMKKYAATSTSPLIYELLPKAGPALKRDLVPILTANGTTALDLFKRMDKGEFPTAWVDVETRWRYQRGKGEMANLAKKLFGEASSDRAAVVKDYMVATTMKGDAKKGQAVFATICITCHKHGTMGVDVGPPLSDVKVKPPEGLLSDILDPNRMFEARWSAYTVETKDGRTLSGLIQSETSDSIVLAMMGGAKETISRSAIKEMKSLDRTLMPVGLEAAITKEQMADLLAFLLGK
jgi:putative membrane-bound dehydrogenase-like protein